MIVRIWRGWTTIDDADTYQRLVDTSILPEIMGRDIEGLGRADLLRRDVDHEVEFTTVMTFDHWDAVKEFAGPDPTASYVPAAARDVLSRFDDRSTHHEHVNTHRPV